MSAHKVLINKLATLNKIAEALNQAEDINVALQNALERLVELMELETGWIFLSDPSSKNRWWGRGYRLAAHHNLPPALALTRARAWKGDCECQGLCNSHELARAYNRVRCTRLFSGGDRAELALHATVPLYSGGRVLGILNVAAPDWSAFSEEALTLLTTAGSQMSIALERSQLFDMLHERRIYEQAALLELSNQLLSHLDPNELMNHLVEEVKRLLKADACTLFLPSEEPEYLAFSAASGWYTDPVSQERRAPANEVSGAGLVMQTQQPLLVHDLTRNNPAPWMPAWMAREGFRGHAVMPLIAEGHSIGAMCISNRSPRDLDEDEVRFLRLLTNQAAIAIEKARLHQESLKRQRLVQELSVARQIQLDLLPTAPPEAPGWEFAAHYRPARMVGGDFYDFFNLPGKSGEWGLVIADVADKGVPSALYMALTRTVIRTTAFTGRSPASTLMRANKLILNDSRSDLFLSAFYAKLDTNTGRLIYCNAGHNPPLWLCVEGGEFVELRTRGIILGAIEVIELDEHRVDVAHGDLVVFYTDGVTEAVTLHDEEFGVERLREVIAAHAQDSAQEVLQAIVDAVNDFEDDAPPSDDLTLVVVKRGRGVGSRE